MRPGHGAPTGDVRKKKFTEHQLARQLRRTQSMFSLEDESSRTYQQTLQGRSYSDDMALDPRVSTVRYSTVQYSTLLYNTWTSVLRVSGG